MDLVQNQRDGWAAHFLPLRPARKSIAIGGTRWLQATIGARGGPACLTGCMYRLASKALIAVPLFVPAALPPLLLMHEERALEVPTGFHVTGGVIAPNGRVVVWSSGAPYVLVEENGRLLKIGYAQTRGPLAAWIREDTIEVLDSAKHALVKFPERGAPPLTVHAMWRGVALDAAATSTGWSVLVTTDSGVLRVDDLDRAGRIVDTLTVPQILGNAVPGRRSLASWRVSPAGGGVLVCHTLPPITFAMLGPNMRPVTGELSTATAATRMYNLRLLIWAASPVVSIGRGMLVSVADLGSDRRLIVRLDSLGQIEHTIALRTPLGLLASSPRRHEVAALRETDGTEVVVYRYDWQANSR